MEDQEAFLDLAQYSNRTVRSLVFLDVSHGEILPHAKVEIGDLGFVIGVDPAEERPLRVTFPQVPAYFFLKPREVELVIHAHVLTLG